MKTQSPLLRSFLLTAGLLLGPLLRLAR